MHRFREILEAHDVLRTADISDDDVADYFGHFYEFVLEDREIAFTPEYASETVRRMFDPSSPTAHVARSSNVPPAFVITQRINLGLHAVLGRLRAKRNWRRIAFELWPFVDGDPSTPMGEAEAAWLESRGRMLISRLVFDAPATVFGRAVELPEELGSQDVLIQNRLGTRLARHRTRDLHRRAPRLRRRRTLLLTQSWWGCPLAVRSPPRGPCDQPACQQHEIPR